MQQAVLWLWRTSRNNLFSVSPIFNPLEETKWTVWTHLTIEGQLLSAGLRDMLLSTTAMEAMRCEGAS